MKAVILAAGMGNRLEKYTKDNTKAMVKVNGKRLIEYTVTSLIKYGVKDFVIVVGYKKDNLISFINKRFTGINIKFIENNDFDKTNNIYSLYLAKDELDDDIILLESDIIFEDTVIKELVDDKDKDVVLVDKYEKWMDGTVTILDDNNNIVNFVDKTEFDWKCIDSYYKTVNIYKLSKEFLLKKYIPFLEAHIKCEGLNSYYEQVLKVITQLRSVKLKAKKIGLAKWYEIDDVQDLDIASVIFSSDGITKYKSRYGGYWRFPKLKDYCYLVNPYFPSKSMLEEIKASFNELISEYPSGMGVQRLLASKMFKCDLDSIIVGNGAAELINELSKCINGKILIVNPTFNEYAERFGLDKVIYYNTEKNGYNYLVEDIIKASFSVDAAVIINPDNPSGHYFSKQEIIEILNYFKLNNKMLILDESFIDFAGLDKRYTMIDSNILNDYKNLIVIKSISKSYGVPGLRLGVLACSDTNIIKKINNSLSIWNINSFGEFFMQVIGKYQKDYENACDKIAQERDRMYEKLKSIPYLKVFPSKANYFLCRLNSIKAKELADMLLNEDNILIKDCTGKKGFSTEYYVRIAVRDKEDNDYLINCLQNKHIMN